MLVKYEPWAIQDKEKQLWGVKILEGEFAGVALAFNDFDMKDLSDQLVLDYTVFQVPDGKTKEELECAEFESVLQKIIVDILEKAITYHENRNSDSPESGE